jgi:predicted nuclease of predicted toxin-antitoxin system
MQLWIDAQLSPLLAKWISENFAAIEPEALKRVAELTGAGLRISKDYVDGLQ